MSVVIGFADFIENRAIAARHAVAARPMQQQSGFTLRDRQDLEHWSNDVRQVSIDASESGVFAMLYQAGQPWASWAVARQGRAVLLWDCVTLADIGRFPSMMAALAAVPIVEFRAPVANVIQLAAARQRAAQI